MQHSTEIRTVFFNRKVTLTVQYQFWVFFNRKVTLTVQYWYSYRSSSIERLLLQSVMVFIQVFFNRKVTHTVSTGIHIGLLQKKSYSHSHYWYSKRCFQQNDYSHSHYWYSKRCSSTERSLIHSVRLFTQVFYNRKVTHKSILIFINVF